MRPFLWRKVASTEGGRITAWWTRRLVARRKCAVRLRTRAPGRCAPAHRAPGKRGWPLPEFRSWAGEGRPTLHQADRAFGAR